jgi:hypothetical protein
MVKQKDHVDSKRSIREAGSVMERDTAWEKGGKHYMETIERYAQNITRGKQQQHFVNTQLWNFSFH